MQSSKAEIVGSTVLSESSNEYRDAIMLENIDEKIAISHPHKPPILINERADVINHGVARATHITIHIETKYSLKFRLRTAMVSLKDSNTLCSTVPTISTNFINNNENLANHDLGEQSKSLHFDRTELLEDCKARSAALLAFLSTRILSQNSLVIDGTSVISRHPWIKIYVL